MAREASDKAIAKWQLPIADLAESVIGEIGNWQLAIGNDLIGNQQ